jgi:hypothetical protein
MMCGPAKPAGSHRSRAARPRAASTARWSVAGLKVTVDAALRARDVSRPTAAQQADAERALPDRLAARRTPPPESGQPPASGDAAIRPSRRPEAADHAAESPESLTAGQQARRGPRHRPPRPGDRRFGDRWPRDRTAGIPGTGIPETDGRRAGAGRAEGGRAEGGRAEGDEPRPAPGASGPGGAAEDAGSDPGESAGAPGAKDRQAGESESRPPAGRPRMRRRYRLGRLPGRGGPGRPARHYSPGPPADHGSGGSSPDFS